MKREICPRLKERQPPSQGDQPNCKKGRESGGCKVQKEVGSSKVSGACEVAQLSWIAEARNQFWVKGRWPQVRVKECHSPKQTRDRHRRNGEGWGEADRNNLQPANSAGARAIGGMPLPELEVKSRSKKG